MDEQLAQQWLKGTLKGELDKRGMTYADLARRLTEIGVEENERNLRNKIARGTFSAVFLCQCLEAIGVKNFKIDLLEFLKSVSLTPAEVPIASEGFDGRQTYKVRLKWSHDRPSGASRVIDLSSDEFPAREADTNIVCGNCDGVLLPGWRIDDVREQFKDTGAVARCGLCGAFNELPGSGVRVEST